MEVFVLSYSSTIKGESITTIEGVYSSSNQVNEAMDKIITDIETFKSLKLTIMKNLLIVCLVISLAADSLLFSGIFGLALYAYNK